MKNLLKNNFGINLIIILAVIPFFIWFFMLPITDRFLSFPTILRSLGQITGLLGMTLLSINFILAARFKFLDKLFNGLNRVYIKHHLVGAIAFCLLLFHPTFLIIQYLFFSLKASFNFIFSFQDLAIIFGELALLVFIVLMVITFYLNFKYQNWKNTHKYLGLVLFIGLGHMLLIPSDISNNLFLRYYLIILTILGIYSYLYRTIFSVYEKGEYQYKLKEVIKINDNIFELKLTPLAKKIKFSPGQFVFLRFKHSTQTGNPEDILVESHPFSITSVPSNEELSLGIKILGDYTSMVYLLKPGVFCLIEGPFGTFSYLRAKTKRQIWIGGGIGITPFLSMARQIKASGTDTSGYKIDLYYTVKNNSEAAFGEEFEKIAEQNINFKFHQHFSEKEGYISANFISQNSQNLKDAEIFLCGPLGFMQSLRKQFIKLGFINKKIHSEEFSIK